MKPFVATTEHPDRAISRLISLLERGQQEGVQRIKKLYPHCGRAHVIGITGPPGSGKSCLVSALIGAFRARGKSVGVLAVDPSSPFTGGAILGDRDRMGAFAADPEVFIRSFATRGSSGGLAAVVNDAVDVLDAFGKEVILVETVGVGQIELDIAQLAHTVLLVLVPGYGDSLQAMKAGIMEIGDVLVMNKADQPGADRAVNDLCFQHPLKFGATEYKCSRYNAQHWGVPVVKTCALKNTGLDDLVFLASEHYAFLQRQDLLSEKNRQRRKKQFLDILSHSIRNSFLTVLKTDPDLQRWTSKIETLDIDPYTAAEKVIQFIQFAREAAVNTKHS
ncbi:MAG: methylmalonyl Co-A mutase-associated GTPase MeaB [Desulfuromonadales bacterium]|nr:methylmalonyl Co-A mutase-associated GTPase MeaB [Desulfuromonadales bacterium]